MRDLIQPVLQQVAVLLLSCIDDVIIMLLGKFGVSLPGLPAVSAILITLTLSGWLYRLLRCLSRRYQAAHCNLS